MGNLPMKVHEAQAQMPLPSSLARAIEEPAIRLKSLDEESAMAGWIGCLARGRHDFDDEGDCVDCNAKRTA